MFVFLENARQIAADRFNQSENHEEKDAVL